MQDIPFPDMWIQFLDSIGDLDSVDGGVEVEDSVLTEAGAEWRPTMATLFITARAIKMLSLFT